MWSRGVMCVTSMLCTGSQFSMFEKNTQTVWLGKSGGFEKPRGGQDGGKKLTPNQGRKQKKNQMEGVEDPFIDGDEWMMHHISLI